jgi:hypothetical protein
MEEDNEGKEEEDEDKKDSENENEDVEDEEEEQPQSQKQQGAQRDIIRNVMGQKRKYNFLKTVTTVEEVDNIRFDV